MRNLIIFLIVVLTQITNVFSQSNTDTINCDRPNAFLLEELVFNKFKTDYFDIYGKKLKNNYETHIVTRFFNFSYLFMDNHKLSDTFFIPQFVIFYQFNEMTFPEYKIFDSTLLKYDIPLYNFYFPIYGRMIDDTIVGVKYVFDKNGNSTVIPNDNLGFCHLNGYVQGNEYINLLRRIKGNKDIRKYKKITEIIDIPSNKTYSDVSDIIYNNEVFSDIIDDIENYYDFGMSIDFNGCNKIILTITLTK